MRTNELLLLWGVQMGHVFDWAGLRMVNRSCMSFQFKTPRLICCGLCDRWHKSGGNVVRLPRPMSGYPCSTIYWRCTVLCCMRGSRLCIGYGYAGCHRGMSWWRIGVGGVARWDFKTCEHVRRNVIVSWTEPRTSCVETETAEVAQLEKIPSTGLFFMPNDATFVAAICKFFCI